MKDLVLLVADKNIEYGIRGLLNRPAALGARAIDAQYLVHPRRDPGCIHEAHDFLRPFVGDFSRAIVMFDREGSGRDDTPALTLSEEVKARIAATGWADRIQVIVLDPELETWVFSASPHVASCLGWPKGRGDLRLWLEGQILWTPGQAKPARPKEALERVLREVRRPRSSSIYECLGRRVSLKGCNDEALARFRASLVAWFPRGNGEHVTPNGTV